MTDPLRELSRQYATTLWRYLGQPQEAWLQRAYEFGRGAIARGLGVLDMAHIHQTSLDRCLARAAPPQSRSCTLKTAEPFFLELLSPFEAAHRGFREANSKLRQLNAALENQNLQLARMNRRLVSEIAERKRMEQALRQSEKSLRFLSGQILHIQEEERKRLSRELHDQVGGDLAAISMHLAMAQPNGQIDRELLKRKLAETQELLGRTMDIVQRFARELRPTILDDLGLLPALRSHLRSFALRTGLRVRFHGCPEAERLNVEQKTAVFRVAQESLTNVAKHAQARQVSVTLLARRDGVQLKVKDDGKAFQVEQQLSGAGKKRLGLLGMQERVRQLNGGFVVKSAPGRGTTVSVKIPFQSGGDPSRAK